MLFFHSVWYISTIPRVYKKKQGAVTLIQALYPNMDENTTGKRSNPIDQRCWLLVSLKLAGEATPAELAELTTLLRDHPDWTLRMELFANLWQQKDRQTARPDFNRHLQRLSNHLADPTLQYEQSGIPARDADPTPTIETRPTTRPGNYVRLRKTLSIAATFAGALLLIGLYQLQRNNNPNQTQKQGLNTVSTRPGSRSKLQLPDGTLVWLNADSRLSYKIDNGTANREVTLTGEAYFDVARDKDHPFLIHTNTIDIRVLGTAFDVQCYGNDPHTETSLFQGSVEVTLKNNPAKKIVLQPSEKLIVHNNEMSVSNINTKASDPDEPLMTVGKVHYQQKDSGYIETLWTKNQLAFDDRTLEEVGHQIERWYGARLTITDDKLKSERFSGVFEDESLPQVMEALRMTGSFHYSIHKKEVIITP